MKAFHELGLMLAVVGLVSAQNNCNFYKSASNYYYVVDKCSTTVSVSSFRMSIKPVCSGGVMTLNTYSSSTNCSGQVVTSQPTPGNFKCDGVACEVEFEYSTISFTASNMSCTSKSPREVIYGVPGYCSQSNSVYYCGTNGTYWGSSCSSATGATPFVPINQCITTGTEFRINTCVGGPNPPNGVLGYQSANTYTNCNFLTTNRTTYPIDKCRENFVGSTLVRCLDADTAEVGSWLSSTTCSGSPYSVQTWKRGDPGVDMLCTGVQCIVEEDDYSLIGSGTCTGQLLFTNQYVPGRCINNNIFYCYGTGNNQIFKESYSSGCQPQFIYPTLGAIYNSSCQSGSTWRCTMNSMTPPFGSVGAGNMLSLGVSIVGMVLFFVFGV